MHQLDINRLGKPYFDMSNRRKSESVSDKIQKRILRGGDDRLWTFRDFLDIASARATAVAATLSRLSKSGELRRVRRGVYYRPKKTVFGESHPNPEAVVKILLNTRKALRTGEFNRLGLTTQMSNTLTSAANRPVRIKGDRGMPLRFVSRPLSEQKGIHEEERTALDSLRDIEKIPDTTPAKTISRMTHLVSRGQFDFARLARFALAEPPRVRALLGAIGEEAGIDSAILQPLRRSLNPLSTYRIPDAVSALSHSKEWHIK
jgi:hypothetical protein